MLLVVAGAQETAFTPVLCAAGMIFTSHVSSGFRVSTRTVSSEEAQARQRPNSLGAHAIELTAVEAEQMGCKGQWRLMAQRVH